MLIEKFNNPYSSDTPNNHNNSQDTTSLSMKMPFQLDESPLPQQPNVRLNNEEKAKMLATSIFKSDYYEPDFESSVSSLEEVSLSKHNMSHCSNKPRIIPPISTQLE